jgi:hypothetical protein
MAIISLKDYGTFETPKNTLEAFQKAISHLHDGDTLLLEKREYRLQDAVVLSHLNHVTLEGQGASFINLNFNPRTLEGQNLTILRLEHCAHMVLGDFSLDYDKGMNLTGTIVALGKEYIDIELIKEDRYLKGDEYFMTVNNFTPSLALDDRLAHSVSTFYKSEKISESILRLYCPVMEAKVGDKVYASMKMNSTPAVDCEEDADILFHDIRVYSSNRFLFYISPNSGSYTFREIVGKVHEGSERLIPLNADAIHVAGIEGSLTLEDCTFIGLGDDGLNVHTCSARVLDVQNEKIAVEDAYFRRPLLSSWGKKGQRLAVYDQTTFKEKESGVIASISGKEIVLEKPIASLRKGDFLVDMSVLPSVKIERCHFERGRARGILLRSHDIEVRDCLFKGFALSGILIAADLDFWFEMIPSKHVVIENNVLEETALADVPVTLGAINIKLSDDHVFYTYGKGIFNDITLAHNTIKKTRHNGIFAQSVKGLTITDNLIQDYCFGSQKAYQGYAISLLSCEDVLLKGNSCQANEISVVEHA